MEWLKNPDWIMAIAEAAAPLIAIIWWLARLEGKVKEHSKEIDKMETKNDNMFEKLFDKLSGIEVGIAELKGKWSATDNQK